MKVININEDMKVVDGYIVPKRQSGKFQIAMVGNEVELECFRVPIDWVRVRGTKGYASRSNFVVDVYDEKGIGVNQVIFPQFNSMATDGPVLVEIYRAKRKEN
jgi:hypothetical protein